MRECESGSDSERIYGYICYIKEGIPRFLRPRADLLRMMPAAYLSAQGGC